MWGWGKKFLKGAGNKSDECPWGGVWSMTGGFRS